MEKLMSRKTDSVGVDFVCERMLDYLFENKADALHVRRVASWIGMLALAIDKRRDEWGIRKRQVVYRIGNQWYKIRYKHTIKRGGRTVGGIEIVQVHGLEDGAVTAQFTCLDDVEKFYVQCLTTPRRQAA
jgi:hypothetical protein